MTQQQKPWPDKTFEEKLETPLPTRAVSERPAGGGRSVQYISHYDLVKLLNMLCGNLGWTQRITRQPELVTVGSAIIATASVELLIFGLEGEVIMRREDAGTCGVTPLRDGSINDEAIETAMKGAVSDATKRAAHTLGPLLGLELLKR